MEQQEKQLKVKAPKRVSLILSEHGGKITRKDLGIMLMNCWPMRGDELIHFFYAARDNGLEDYFFDVVTTMRDGSLPEACVELTPEARQRLEEELAKTKSRQRKRKRKRKRKSPQGRS